MCQVASLEELWKAAPDARLEDLDAAQEEPENQLTPVVLRYEDAAQYQVGWVGGAPPPGSVVFWHTQFWLARRKLDVTVLPYCGGAV